jgi:hypothetical protein
MLSKTYSFSTPRLEATSAGEYPSEIGRAIVRNVSLPTGDKFVQTTCSTEIVVEGEDDGVPVLVAPVSVAETEPVDDGEAESPVEEGAEAPFSRCLEPGIEAEVELPASAEEVGETLLVVLLTEDGAPSAQAIF